MPVRPPQHDELRRIADRHGLGLSDEDLATFRTLITGVLPSYAEIERLPEQTLPVRFPREGGYRPTTEDNPLNALYWRCSITGADDGLLAGKRVAIKDNVAVAGIPMMNGCAVLEGVCPRGRRHRRDPHPRCGGRDRRQGRL